MYAQNNEDNIVLSYYKQMNPKRWDKRHEAGFELTLLDVGANDGKTFSNSLFLIEQGFCATLIEPSPKAFDKLKKLHDNNTKVKMHNFGFALFNGVQTFLESGGHNDGDDVALYSTLHKEETERWGDSVKFTEIEAEFVTWIDFRNHNTDKYDFISIDCEGFDLTLLKQMDLEKLQCSVLIIEWNGVESIRTLATEYCAQFDMLLSVVNAENLMFIKKQYPLWFPED